MNNIIDTNMDTNINTDIVVGDVVQYREFVGVVTHIAQNINSYKSATAMDKNGDMRMFNVTSARKINVHIPEIKDILSKVCDAEKEYKVL